MANAAFLASFAWQIAYSLAAPTPGTTTPATPVADPGWKKEPRGRGTFSILSSSVLTLALCVWTAIHPNIRPGVSSRRRVVHKLLLVILGMLAPEVVLAIASGQWREARRFHRNWCKFYGVDPGSKGDTLRMQGAFFVTMGGVSLVPARTIPASIHNTVSPDGYLKLSRTGVSLEVIEATRTEVEDGSELERLISAKPEPGGVGEPAKKSPEEGILKKEFIHFLDVQDKAKAEMLGKTLACLQALWMLMQCIVRKAGGLPVTLLEIHVAMHVVCAVGMYGFWLNKPQDVGEPISVITHGDRTQNLVEVAYNQKWYNNEYTGLKVEVGEFNEFRRDRTDDEIHDVQPLPTTTSVLFLGYKKKAPDDDEDDDPARLVVPYEHVLDLVHIRIGFPKRHKKEKYDIRMPYGALSFYTHAAQAIGAGRRPALPLVDLMPLVSLGDAKLALDDTHVSHAFPAIFIILAYGGCHAAAWNTHFPSPVECLLWRLSSVVIAVLPGYCLFAYSLHNSGRHTLYHIFTLFMRKVPGRLFFRAFVVPVVTILTLAVIFGRVYLLIESFLSLRSLPWGSFDSTPWEDYWPHF